MIRKRRSADLLCRPPASTTNRAKSADSTSLYVKSELDHGQALCGSSKLLGTWEKFKERISFREMPKSELLVCAPSRWPSNGLNFALKDSQFDLGRNADDSNPIKTFKRERERERVEFQACNLLRASRHTASEPNEIR